MWSSCTCSVLSNSCRSNENYDVSSRIAPQALFYIVCASLLTNNKAFKYSTCTKQPTFLPVFAISSRIELKAAVLQQMGTYMQRSAITRRRIGRHAGERTRNQLHLHILKRDFRLVPLLHIEGPAP